MLRQDVIWGITFSFLEKWQRNNIQKKKKKTLKINLVPPSTESIPKNSFLTDFVHLNFVMVYTNNALIPDPKKVWH